MKAVLISIQPRYCELIAIGQKTLEVRKNKPKLKTPFKCYIYQTKKKWWYKLLEQLKSFAWAEAVITGQGKVIGEFTCDRIYQFTTCNCTEGMDITTEEVTRMSCLTYEELRDYELSAERKENRIYLVGLYGWHISDLKIYEKPKDLNEFYKCGALPMEDLDEDLCNYCSATDYGDQKEYHTPNGVYMCEGRWCTDAYQAYLDEEFWLARAPQSWCYVEELRCTL